MDDRQLLRYSRHVLLDGFGIEGQTKLAESRVLVVGAGGLGSAALPYIASAGVGRIIIADGDSVDLTNPQRQILHGESSIGTHKAASARHSLLALNSTIDITAIEQRLSPEALDSLVADVDLVLDCFVWDYGGFATILQEVCQEFEVKGFKLNPYDPCVANKQVKGEQLTVCLVI